MALSLFSLPRRSPSHTGFALHRGEPALFLRWVHARTAAAGAPRDRRRVRARLEAVAARARLRGLRSIGGSSVAHKPGPGARSRSVGGLPLSCAGPLYRRGCLSGIIHESAAVACSTSVAAPSLPLPDPARRMLGAPGSSEEEAGRARIRRGGDRPRPDPAGRRSAAPRSGGRNGSSLIGPCDGLDWAR
jgi:hypothetical protein